MMPSSVTGIVEQIRPPPGVVDVKWAELTIHHAEAVKAIADAMGIEVLEKGLENIFRQLREKPIGG